MSRRSKVKSEATADSSNNLNGGSALRQMSITESFRKAKILSFKFEKPVIVTSVPIEIDSDSETDFPPFELNCDKTKSNASDDEGIAGMGSPAKRIRSSPDAFEPITSTPKTQRNFEATPNISWPVSSSATILPSQAITKDSPVSNISYSPDRTLLNDYTEITFDASTVPFPPSSTLGPVERSNTTELLEMNYSDHFCDDSAQDASDSFLKTLAAPDLSRSGNCSSPAAKQRLNFDKIGTLDEKNTELNCSRHRPEADHVISNNNEKSCKEPLGSPKRKRRTKKRKKSEQESKKQRKPSDQQATQNTPSRVNKSSGDLPQKPNSDIVNASPPSCSSINVDSANPKSKFHEKSGHFSVDRQQFTSKSVHGPVNHDKPCTSTSTNPNSIETSANKNANNNNKVAVDNEGSLHFNTSLCRQGNNVAESKNPSISQTSVAASEDHVQNRQNPYSRNSVNLPTVSKGSTTTETCETLKNSTRKEVCTSQAAASKITSDTRSGKRADTEQNVGYGRNRDSGGTSTMGTHTNIVQSNSNNSASVMLPNTTQLKLAINSSACTKKNLSSGPEVQNGRNSSAIDTSNDRQMASTSNKSKSNSEKPSTSTAEQPNNDTRRNGENHKQLNGNEQPSCSRQNAKLMQKTSSTPAKTSIWRSPKKSGSPLSPSKGSPSRTREIKSLKAKEGKQLQIKQLDELVALLKVMVTNRYLKSLLSPQEFAILKDFVQMEDNQKYVVMKLYIWKRSWYNIFKFCSKAKICINEKDILSIFDFLKKENFVDSDYRGETEMIDLLQEMEVTKIKEVMEELRIRHNKGTKDELINKIIWETNSQTTLGRKTRKDMVMDAIEKKLGFAIKIRDEVCEAFYHSYLLATFTNRSFEEDIQTYFREIIHNKVVFPSAPIEECIVFYSRDKFVRYAEARKVENELEELLTHKDNHFLIYSLGAKTYQRLKDCPKDSTDHANMPHLARFTAEHVNSRILSTCCEKVFSKERGKPEEVKKWLEYLIERFPKSRRLWKWYKKLIWLHMRHLPEISYKMAAKILIEAFETKRHLLGERGEFELGSLGARLKNGNRHRLDQIYHDRILALIPRTIDVSAFPHIQIDSQCIRSEVSGRKRVYIKKGDGEMTTRYVEQVALEYYAENGYPGGQHAEGSLISALCMLYFWDIIYNPKKGVPGTFISKLQTAPLDMFSQYFYKNRKYFIDARINEISSHWSGQELIRFGKNTWQQHSHELSAFGTLMNVIKDADTVEVLVITIGRKILANIFKRLLKDIKEFKSGMPDLLVWNVDHKTHKFVEVKGEGDKLSPNQTLWLKYLQEIGANIEVCIVHSTGSKRKKMKKGSNAETQASTSNVNEENNDAESD